MKDKFEKLIKFNRNMGILHLIQAFMMLFLATSVISKIAEFSPKITKLFLEYNQETKSLEQSSSVLFELPFGILVSLFLFISAGAHFFIVYKKKRYVEDLKNGINKFRWIEYALSSSIMIVLIATLFGVYDIGSLILIFVVNASMNLFGLVMEQLNVGVDKKKVNWEPFIWGAIAGLAPWIVILIYMFGNGNIDMVPWFVWAIIGTYFVAFNTFPINMILQYKKIGKWKDYLYGERVYIILSLIAKSALAWLVLFGAMQP
jgi:hypothetical protein